MWDQTVEALLLTKPRNTHTYRAKTWSHHEAEGPHALLKYGRLRGASV